MWLMALRGRERGDTGQERGRVDKCRIPVHDWHRKFLPEASYCACQAAARTRKRRLRLA